MCSGSRPGKEDRACKRRQLRLQRVLQSEQVRHQQLRLLQQVRRSHRLPRYPGPQKRARLWLLILQGQANRKRVKRSRLRKKKRARPEKGPVPPPRESGDQNRVAIQPLKRTYVRV